MNFACDMVEYWLSSFFYEILERGGDEVYKLDKKNEANVQPS